MLFRSWVRDGAGWRVRIEGRGVDAGRATECVVTHRSPEEVTVSGLREGLAGELGPVGRFVRTGR